MRIWLTMKSTMRITLDQRLQQINGFSNENGNFLDLVFTTNINNITCELASVHELLDSNTRHHSAIEVVLGFSAKKENHIRTRNIRNTNFAKIRIDLNAKRFPQTQLTRDQIANIQHIDARKMAEDFTNELYRMQMDCTTLSYSKITPLSPKHPWAKGVLLRD